MLAEYKDVFLDELPKGLPLDRTVEIAITLEKNARPKTGPICKLSIKELEEMKTKIDEALGLGFMRPRISSWVSPVLFTPNKDGTLRMCIDACSNKRRPVPETRGRLPPPVLRLQNRHYKLLGVRWYFGEFPPQPILVRERLESRGYMVDRLRELMLLGQLSPVQKVELSTVLDTISRIVMNM